ncbi:MAG: EAL domain-containing protein [Lautropia sp.]
MNPSTIDREHERPARSNPPLAGPALRAALIALTLFAILVLAYRLTATPDYGPLARLLEVQRLPDVPATAGDDLDATARAVLASLDADTQATGAPSRVAREHGTLHAGGDGRPTWAVIDVPADAADAQADPRQRSETGGTVVELRTVLGSRVQAWEADPAPRFIGEATRADARRNADADRVVATTRGFAIAMDRSAALATRLLVRVETSARSAIDVVRMPAVELAGLLQERERRGGMLLGAMLTLACLSLLIAAITGERNYLLFAALAAFSMLSAAFTAGLERTWIGYGFDALLGHRLAPYVHAIKALLALLLVTGIFGPTIERLHLARTFDAMRALVALMLVSAVLLPTHLALPSFAALLLPAAALMCFAIVRIAMATRTPPALLYLGALGYLLACAIAEGAYFFGWIPARPHLLNLRSGDLAWALALGAALGADVLVTSRRRAAAEARALEQSRRLQAHRNLAPAGLFSLDAAGQLVDCNRAFYALFELDGAPPDALPLHWDALMGRGAFAALHEALARIGTPRAPAAQTRDGIGQETLDLETRVRSSVRGDRWFRVRVARDGDAIEGTIEDIGLRKREEAQARRLAEHDQLTGLLNRRGLERELDAAFEQARRGVPMAVAYVDFDRFKLINDLFGHAAGDAVLRDSAVRMGVAIGDTHRIARMGGDEFVLILHGTRLADATAVCDTVLAALRSQPFIHEEKAFSIEASIGLTMIDPTLSAMEIIGFADRSCAAAKKLGGSRLLAFESNVTLVREHREEARLVGMLRDRMPFDRMTWQAQPIASIRHARASVAVEALLRMVGDDGLPIEAYRVVRAAERHGLMSTIDRWMLEEVLSWIEAHPEAQDRLAFVNLNLSGASLNDERFVDGALGLLRERSKAARRLCIEITESVALYDLGNMRRLIDKVKACGVLVALDDFGAGYTSFNYLRELPADLLKIDGGFVRLMARDAPSRGITRMIIELAHELNMGCVAEAAESPEILRLLKGMKVDYAQGYAICPPLAPDAVLSAAHPHELIAAPEIRQILRLPPVLKLAERQRSAATG